MVECKFPEYLLDYLGDNNTFQCEDFMSEIIFVIKAFPISFNKSDLYTKEFIDNKSNFVIKSISDSFFLSNDFRKNYTIYFLSELEGNSYLIVFKGDELRFLGPSYFSAAHLLLRVKNNILYPNSKEGKLTPGISIHKHTIKWISRNYKESKWFKIGTSMELSENIKDVLSPTSNIFLFGFDNTPDIDIEITDVSFGPLEIDEQIIMTNYMIESVI